MTKPTFQQVRKQHNITLDMLIVLMCSVLVLSWYQLWSARGEREDGLHITCWHQQRLSVSSRPGKVETSALRRRG